MTHEEKIEEGFTFVKTLSTINVEPALGYMFLNHPKELQDKVKGKIFASLPENQQLRILEDYIIEHGSIFYEIIGINGSNDYKIGDKVMVEGNMEQKSVLKPKELWANQEKPEFYNFLLTGIGNIQAKLTY